MEPLLPMSNDSNQGIRRCPNCGRREDGKSLMCMHCFWHDGILSRFTGECELRRWADELDAAGVLKPNKARVMADTIKNEREQINSLISDWQAGAIVVKEDNTDDVRRDDRRGQRTPQPSATPDTQCGC